MKIGIPKEYFKGEHRVALIPKDIAALKKAGLEVFVESNAGIASGYTDAMYTEKGAQIIAHRSELFMNSDIILQMNGTGDVNLLHEEQVLIGFLNPLLNLELMQRIAEKKVIAFSMELIPRISRAQSMDALSSMANITGYKAVLLAADMLPRMFPMMMTAAGTITPARVFVIGAGVAGLQAIATARRLGAVVQGYDVRPAVKQEVESLGAKFVELPLETNDAEDKGGYAKIMDEKFYQRQREMMAKIMAESDVVITTAVVPGKKAPILITRDMVKGMHPGAVIIDLAAEQGGNCELTKPNEIVEESGVKISGPVNLASSIPYHASQMYSKNISTFLGHLINKGKLELNMEDQIIKETLVTKDGQVVHPRVKELLTKTS